MALLVYLLCALTSFACAALLLRGYRIRPSRLLFWSALCFFGLFLNNVALILDMVVFPDVFLMPVRIATAFGSASVLLYGLIWEVA